MVVTLMPESSLSMVWNLKPLPLLESMLRAEHGHVPLQFPLVEFVGKFAVYCSYSWFCLSDPHLVATDLALKGSCSFEE